MEKEFDTWKALGDRAALDLLRNPDAAFEILEELADTFLNSCSDAVFMRIVADMQNNMIERGFVEETENGLQVANDFQDEGIKNLIGEYSGQTMPDFRF